MVYDKEQAIEAEVVENKIDHSKDGYAEIWATLSRINCNGHAEKKRTGKNELTYLSWTWGWSIIMGIYPDATFSVREWDGIPWLRDARAGYMVSTSVCINGVTRSMWLPVMDANNRAMKDEPYTVKTRNGDIIVAPVDMMAINKATMRCLVKTLALFGLGLYIYAGEDLPMVDQEDVDF